MSRLIKAIGFAAALAGASALPGAADYPDQQITMIVPFGAGGGSDRVARTIDRFWQEETGQSFNFQYQPGASGAVGTDAIARANPDGYTVGIVNLPNMILQPVSGSASFALEDSAPKVLQRVLLDAFQNTGRVRAVGLPGQSLLINYQVVTEVRAFQAETFEVDRARVEIVAKLLDDSNGRVLADRIFTAVVPIADDSAEAAAEGLNLAAQALASDVVDWTLAAI